MVTFGARPFGFGPIASDYVAPPVSQVQVALDSPVSDLVFLVEIFASGGASGASGTPLVTTHASVTLAPALATGTARTMLFGDDAIMTGAIDWGIMGANVFIWDDE